MQSFTKLAVLSTLLGLSVFTALGQNNPRLPVIPPDPSSPAAIDPNSAPKAVDNRTYEIGVQDVLRIEVYQDANMSRQVIIRPDGKFSLPMLGDVQAEGLTPEHLKKTLTEALTSLYQSPDVTISVMEVRSKSYQITGQTMRTGTFPLVTPIRVYQALVLAGGFQEWASRKKIVIMRGSQRINFNASDFEKGKNLEANIFLQPEDIVVVPR
ncbi:MAG: polysaccharide biosynthesis/export family protein [Acidobacteriota bacterium]